MLSKFVEKKVNILFADIGICGLVVTDINQQHRSYQVSIKFESLDYVHEYRHADKKFHSSFPHFPQFCHKLF